MLSSELKGNPIKWLDYNEAVFERSVPAAVLLWKSLQLSLEAGNQIKTAGCYSKTSFTGADETVFQKWLDMMGMNEKTKRDTKQYRKDYLNRNKQEHKKAKVDLHQPLETTQVA